MNSPCLSCLYQSYVASSSSSSFSFLQLRAAPPPPPPLFFFSFLFQSIKSPHRQLPSVFVRIITCGTVTPPPPPFLYFPPLLITSSSSFAPFFPPFSYSFSIKRIPDEDSYAKTAENVSLLPFCPIFFW